MGSRVVCFGATPAQNSLLADLRNQYGVSGIKINLTSCCIITRAPKAWIFCFEDFCLGATSDDIQELFLTLHSGSASDGAQGIILDAETSTQVKTSGKFLPTVLSLQS